jgi:hypothetical protein
LDDVRFVQVVVHGGAESFFYSFEAVEDDVVKKLFAHIVPDVFGRIEFRRIRRKLFQHHVIGDSQSARAVTWGAVINHQNKIVWKFFSYMIQENRHAHAVHIRQNQMGRCAVLRTERAVCVNVFTNHLLADDGANARARPASSRIVDPSEPCFILKKYSQGFMCCGGFGISQRNDFRPFF